MNDTLKRFGWFGMAVLAFIACLLEQFIMAFNCVFIFAISLGMKLGILQSDLDGSYFAEI
jgi:hypothetical protein